ncbi:hypothetical protein ACMD2_06982 [Ananas comosus]|uniref:Uncharacterized protein n=1 Tax=Ananas comosus TaxID=4615 RepID=A0A199VN34_ANACO|nr:hypothetical protein ACMD2_06982 [Ananas comosus]
MGRWKGQAHWPGHWAAAFPTHTERRKSETMDFWAGVKRPYQRTETGMSPSSTAPSWYVRRFGCGWYKAASFRDPVDARAKLIRSMLSTSNK